MTYDHSNKIGNQGDVIKHAVLTSLVQHIANKKKSKRFEYTETHCGRPEYILPDSGEWEKGIGELSKKIPPSSPPENLKTYYELFLSPAPRSVGHRYPGSSAIVFSLALQGKMNFQFNLFETDELANADLIRYYSTWSNQVTIHKTDGLSGLKALKSTSLALIDPPDLKKTKELIGAMKYCSENKIPFLCWTPRNSYPPKNEEAETTRSFFKKTKDYDPIRIRWGAWNQQGCRGCQLTVYPKELREIAQTTAEEVVNSMNRDDWVID